MTQWLYGSNGSQTLIQKPKLYLTQGDLTIIFYFFSETTDSYKRIVTVISYEFKTYMKHKFVNLILC